MVWGGFFPDLEPGQVAEVVVTSKLHVLELDARNERALLDKLRAGDREAFRTLHHRYVDRVLALARQLLGSQMAAEDAAQETFLRVFRSLASFRGDSTLATWIFRVATNVCFTQLKRRRRKALEEPAAPGPEHPDTSDGVEVVVDERILAQRISALLCTLDEKKQTTFYLHHVEGMSAAEVAEVLCESRDAVLKRLQRTQRQVLRAYQQLYARPRGSRQVRS